jgi:hypothetical protein
MKKNLERSMLAFLLFALYLFQPAASSGKAAPDDTARASTKIAATKGEEVQLISASSLLTSLGPGAAFPFIDTTPYRVLRAHIAITDATTNCGAGAAPPSNVKVLVGQAGVALVSVMGAATNTGISTTPGQCVFHVTVTAGAGGVPDTVTDIVVVNGGSSALTGINTVTTSATVDVGEAKKDEE